MKQHTYREVLTMFPQLVVEEQHGSFFVSIVSEWLMRLRPRLVFDVGIGVEGFWGSYMRKLGIPCVGIEIWDKYLTQPAMHDFYDGIIVGDIVNLASSLYGDVIILGNVLEHLTQETALSVTRLLAGHCRWLIIMSPLGFHEQAETDDCPYSKHVCGFSPEHFDFLSIVELILLKEPDVVGSECTKPSWFALLAKGSM